MFNADGFFYHPTRKVYATPEELGLNYEPVDFASRDGARLHGWFFPGYEPVAGTVLHVHGNAGNITAQFGNVAWLPSFGWNVFCFDYRGYGRSKGRPTRAGTVADAHAALDYLLGRDDVDANRIVAFGESLGGAISIVVAGERPEIHGLVTDGAFSHYRRIAKWTVRQNPILRAVGWWVPKWLMVDGLDPIDYVSRISPRPILFMHGTADRIVPSDMAKELHAAACEPKELWLIEGMDHYQALHEMSEQVYPRLDGFFRRCMNQA